MSQRPLIADFVTPDCFNHMYFLSSPSSMTLTNAESGILHLQGLEEKPSRLLVIFPTGKIVLVNGKIRGIYKGETSETDESSCLIETDLKDNPILMADPRVLVLSLDEQKQGLCCEYSPRYEEVYNLLSSKMKKWMDENLNWPPSPDHLRFFINNMGPERVFSLEQLLKPNEKQIRRKNMEIESPANGKRTRFYKNGDRMGIKTQAQDETSFLSDVCSFLDAAIENQTFKGDWKFQLETWLPQVLNIVLAFRGYKAEVQTETLIYSGNVLPDDEVSVGSIDKRGNPQIKAVGGNK